MRYVAHFLERVASGLDEAAFVAEVGDHVLVQIETGEQAGGPGDAEVTAQFSPGVIRRQAESSRETAVYALPRTQGPLVVGRAPDCALQILHSSVSKHHAQLEWKGDELWLTDQGSTNGTWLNRHKAEAKQALKVRPDDTLRFGQGDAFLVMSPSAFYHYLKMLRRFGI
ncbi:MAG: FHA domain-containing protein [Planctomycetota bacterium]